MKRLAKLISLLLLPALCLFFGSAAVAPSGQGTAEFASDGASARESGGYLYEHAYSDVSDLPISDVPYGESDSSQTVIGADSQVDPGEVLPAPDDSLIEEPSSGESEDSGTRVVPVMINNVIRDSLASIIATNAYTFTLEERGVVVFAINHPSSRAVDCRWTVTLYEEYSPDGTGKTTDYRELEQLEYNSIGTSVASQPVGVSPGNYRVEVQCYSGFTADKYDLAIGFAAVDNYEIEPNDSVERYTELPLGKQLNGTASLRSDGENDVDCYMFEVTEQGYTVLYFEHSADENGQSGVVSWIITVTNADGYEFYRTTSGQEAATLNSSVIGLAPGYYFVTVESRVHSSVTYALGASFTADTAVESEPNDSAAQATELTNGRQTVGSLSERNSQSDRDYYTFTMTRSGYVSLTFLHEALTQERSGWSVTLMNEHEVVIYSTVSDWSQSMLSCPPIGLTAGKYYVLVDSDNLYFNSTVYRLTVNITQSDGWETEFNNTLETADVITADSSVRGTLVANGSDYDRDCFVFELSESTRMRFKFSHDVINEPDKEGWVVTLIDESGTVVRTFASKWDDSELNFASTLPAGRYYVTIETGLFINTSVYTVSLETVQS